MPLSGRTDRNNQVESTVVDVVVVFYTVNAASQKDLLVLHKKISQCEEFVTE